MKLPLSAALLASAVLLPSIARADDAARVETLKAFTRCDASFFSSLNTHRDAWQAYAPLKQEKDFTWIAVRDRTDPMATAVPVSAPTIAGLKLLSYNDEVSDLGPLGLYYFWGFTVDGNIDEVAQRFAALLDTPGALQKGEGQYTRSELKVGNSWQSIKPMPGKAPGLRNVERVLIVEPEGKHSRVSCSVQGGVNAGLVALLRPDIAPVDYPRTVAETNLADVPVPPNVLQGLDAPLLQPRFKTLSYTYLSKNGAGKDAPITIRFKAEDGLLVKNEAYGTAFNVDRLMLADLIQLKSKMNGVGEGQVLQTREAEVRLPTSWAPGQTLSAHLKMANVPVKPTDKPTETTLTCKVGERFPARQVFASLTGDAIRLACEQDGYTSSRAFIEDLGVALTLESTSSQTHYVNEIQTLDVVR
ncbi:hypothetical protein [Pseudomonas lurida]|jgi:hypothetical protein|uniref:Uncharacterized protein n=1 Tax=Pseudomonas fluorescens TaxID=294 RepID=A0A5E6QG85_PSEFL|nr:hypothetical protein [Pseudomonas lurida]VVM12690.1 hypothetical protein PS683_00968 [Pseudomonas fluorescens]AOE80395.1 hypothetical protein A7318_17985 [Pseudomonas lurida]MBC3234656.1 hypothetical protein [Pseudomonas lurida]MBC3926219.1 hypothetical protein [Pseudomonas lurida]MBC8982960.1 hypothetical protein [Pseudomonas lurida]